MEDSGKYHAPGDLALQQKKYGRLCLKCDGTGAETRFRLSVKRTNPFKSVGESVQSTTGSRACVLQSCDAYWLPTPFSCFPFTSAPVRHRVPSHFNWTLPTEEEAGWVQVPV